MPNQTKGPKVQKVDKGAAEKAEKAKAKQERKRLKAEQKAAKTQEMANAKAQKVQIKAMRSQSKADVKAHKRSARAEKKAQKAFQKGRPEKTVSEASTQAPTEKIEAVSAPMLPEDGAEAPVLVSAGENGEQTLPQIAEAPEGPVQTASTAAEDSSKEGNKKGKLTKDKKGRQIPQNKKKLILFIAVIAVLVLLIVGGTFFLLRMILGGGRNAETPTVSETDSSSSASMNVGAAGGSKVENADPKSSSENTKETSSKETTSKDKEDTSTDKEADKKESEPVGKKDKNASSKETSSTPAADTGEPVDVVKQAVEGAAGTTGISAMMGSGAVPPDRLEITPDTPTGNPKPGQAERKEGLAEKNKDVDEEAGEKPKKPSSDGTEDLPTALTPTTETQQVPDFKFSEASLNLPQYRYNASTALEAAAHRDIGAYLDKKDDRPGVQVTAVVIGGTMQQPDGSLRVLAYAWGSRYAIADNTLFDYGNMVGPCALDYTLQGGQYVLSKITLARGGDAFEASVREFCGDQVAVADKMTKQSYDLELRGQMLRNVSSYITQNNIPVDFFRASGQVYNKDGTIYMPPGTELPPETSSAEGSAAEGSSSQEGDSLEDDYRVIQDMPE